MRVPRSARAASVLWCDGGPPTRLLYEGKVFRGGPRGFCRLRNSPLRAHVAVGDRNHTCSQCTSTRMMRGNHFCLWPEVGVEHFPNEQNGAPKHKITFAALRRRRFRVALIATIPDTDLVLTAANFEAFCDSISNCFIKKAGSLRKLWKFVDAD